MFFDRVIKISIYLLVFLLPLFWLPFSFEFFEFNKQYLLFGLVSLAFFAWLAKMVLIDKEIRFKKTPLDIFVLAFLFIAILSAIFSVDRGSSLFGFYGRFSDGLIGLLSLGVFYFLIINNVGVSSNRDEIGRETDAKLISVSDLIKTLIWSVFFVVLISYFSIFGVWLKINSLLVQTIEGCQLPAVMLQAWFNPVSGSLEGLAVFLAVIMTLLAGILLMKSEKRKVKNFIYYLLLVACLFLLLIIDFTMAWIVLALTLALFTGFALWKRMFRENVNKLLLPISLIIVAIIGLIISTSGIINKVLDRDFVPQEQILSQAVSWHVAIETATDNVKQGFIGSGIGTFFYNFSRHRPVEFNQDPFWHIRFDRSGNHFAEILGTMGFLGILSYLVLIGLFLLISWIILISKKQEYKTVDERSTLISTPRFARIGDFQLPLLIMFIALLVAQFVYYQNTVLAFVFWLILGLSVVSWQKPIVEKKFSFAKFPELNLVFTILLILVGLAIAGAYFFAQQFYRADMIYAQSQRMALGPARIALVEKAVRMNPHIAQYHAILARTYLDKVLTEMRKPVADQDVAVIEITAAKAIEAAKESTFRGPGQVISWETLAMVYRDIRLVAAGAEEWAIDSFRKAIELEPTNPILHTELGKLLALDDPEKAREKFIKALELKPNYFYASIQLARIYEEEDNLTGAIRIIEDVVDRAGGVALPENVSLVFELGRLFYNDGRIDEAIVKFESILEIFPLHSDTLFSLAVAYEEKDEIDKAIGFFERVLELNPGHQEVIARLEELRGIEE